MYHCHIHFYFVGQESGVFSHVKRSAPWEHFTYTFTESREPSAALAADSDVIFAALQGTDAPERLRLLLDSKRPEAECILLTDAETLPLLTEYLASAAVPGGDCVSLLPLAGPVQTGERRLGNQRISGSDHQQRAEPGLVQGQKRHP